MSLAFDKSTVVKEYKEEIETLKKSNDQLAKKVGNLSVEKDFLVDGVPLEGESYKAWYPLKGEKPL